MPATVRSFAEQILFGETLADKLVSPTNLDDEDRGSGIRVPASPGRPNGLGVVDDVDPFPSDPALAEAGARGRALHYFANHELLALELMALALLRYVDAPPAFRRGLVATMQDEQRHLSLYLERMRTLGTELGDVGVGGYFWRTMSDLDDPAAFVSHMSLTFEQANLDHARHYADLFRRFGDEQTADVMDAVYADEVRHVGFGVRWMAKWHPDEPLLEAHRRTLRSPVTIRRARGRTFDADGRRAAGFPEAYIERMSVVPTARGRPPVVHLYDPTVEIELAHHGYQPDARTRIRTEDLETVPLLYARPDDAVLVRRAPSAAFLRQLQAAGWSLAEPVVTDLDAPRIDAPSLHRVARVQPWGWTPRLARRLRPLRSRAEQDFVPDDGWPRRTFDKGYALSALAALLADGDPRLSPPETVGRLAATIEEVREHVAMLTDAGWPTIALKAPLGSAGRGTIRILDGMLTEPQRGWIARTLSRQHAVIVEPWLPRVFDLSLRLAIDPSHRARIEGVGRFVVNPGGQYLGAVLGKLGTGMPPEVVRWLHGDGEDPRWLDALWKRVSERVAELLAPTGYVGTVGVDAFVHRDREGGLRLRPLVELNTRVHMGHVAVHLAQHVAPGAVGLWWLRRAQDAPEPTLAEHAARLQAEHPVRTRGTPPRISEGVLATTDPSHAREVLALLSVARTLEQAAAQINAPEALVGGSSPTPTSESRR